MNYWVLRWMLPDSVAVSMQSPANTEIKACRKWMACRFKNHAMRRTSQMAGFDVKERHADQHLWQPAL